MRPPADAKCQPAPAHNQGGCDCDLLTPVARRVALEQAKTLCGIIGIPPANWGERLMAKQRRGLDRRVRDRGGEIRKKRSDPLVRTLREEYATTLPLVIGNVLKIEGVESLHQLLKKHR